MKNTSTSNSNDEDQKKKRKRKKKDVFISISQLANHLGETMAMRCFSDTRGKRKTKRDPILQLAS